MITDPQLRLIAAQVLDEGPYKHSHKFADGTDSMPVCGKCLRDYIDECDQGHPCPIPDLPTDELAVLAEKCIATLNVPEKLIALHYLQDQAKANQTASDWWILFCATSTDKILSAGKAKGIGIERTKE